MTAWVSLLANSLISSIQANLELILLELLVRNLAFRAMLWVLSARGPVSGARPLCCSEQQDVHFFQVRCYGEMARVQHSVLITLIISSTASM